MARGLYHQTGVGRNDMVLHQDHRGRWRIDLVTSASGNHTDVTGRGAGAGPNQGYSSAELAFAGALDEQRRRGLRGKTHVWIQKGDGYESYEPEGDYLPNAGSELYDELLAAGCQLDNHASDLYVLDSPEARAILSRHGQKFSAFRSEVDRKQWLDVPFAYAPFWRSRQQPNGRRTGILSDGTRVNVYHQPGSLDEYTVVPHSMDWDAQERGGMRSMLGLSKTGAGFSQWTEGQEGRHLGRKLAWDEVPEELKRHIERRIVGESMVANARGSTVDEYAQRELELYIENEYALVGADNSIGKAIDKNLRRKVTSGKYDPALAPRAWQYLIDEGAKRYTREYGTQEGAAIFSAATRRAVAAEFARAWEAENLKP